jgi:protein Mpv17
MLRQVARAAAFSCVVMFAGDVARQAIVQRGLTRETWDYKSSLRFAVVGATLHGPYFLVGFGLMDKLPFLDRFKSPMAKALFKTCVTQVTIYPLFIGLFFGYMALLEGVPLAAKKKPATDTMVHGAVFWPIANTVNFRFVPSPYRAYYAAGAGVVWNTYVSYLNARKQ